jgi:hypothetical protein
MSVTNNLKEEAFTSALSLKVSVHHGGEGVMKEKNSPHASQEAKKDTGRSQGSEISQRPASSDPLHQAKCLLKFSEPSKMASLW